MAVAYVTDVEGRWDKLASFASGNDDVALDAAGRLTVREGATFVFGGDAIDRGPAGRRIVATLLDAKRRQPGQVVLLAGNRDINKMRLARELRGLPHAKVPPALRAAPRPELLRWIFEKTMGASAAFENRRAELGVEGRATDDEAVVASFLDDLEPGGALSEYLAACQLAHRSGGTLFVHGAVTEENLGHVPDGAARTDDLAEWIARLNAFYATSVKAFRENDRVAPDPGWLALVAYQAPLPGTRENRTSVVYARPADRHGNPELPSRAARDMLARAGVHRVVVGHTPSGDCPAIVRGDDLELVLADNSYGRIEEGSRLAIDEDSLRVDAVTELDGGAREAVRFTLARSDRSLPIGRRDRETARLVKARLARGDFLSFYAFEPGKVEQRAVSAEALAARPLV
ncbi:MAG: hypothetical protein ACAI25_12835 [Planctomycetota bacterium]